MKALSGYLLARSTKRSGVMVPLPCVGVAEWFRSVDYDEKHPIAACDVFSDNGHGVGETVVRRFDPPLGVGMEFADAACASEFEASFGFFRSLIVGPKRIHAAQRNQNARKVRCRFQEVIVGAFVRVLGLSSRSLLLPSGLRRSGPFPPEDVRLGQYAL